MLRISGAWCMLSQWKKTEIAREGRQGIFVFLDRLQSRF